MTTVPIRISGAHFDDWRGFEEQTDGRSRENAVGRSQEAERDNDVGFVLNRLRNVDKLRRLPRLAATPAREGGR